MLFMPLEASSVIGAIGGIAELAREVANRPGGAPPPRGSGSVPRTGSD
jgi:hypothetical protein